jgi:hypothetical protein
MCVAKRLGFTALAVLVVLQACGFYRAEYRDYADVFVRYEAGALEVSMIGEWTDLRNGDKVLGSPYTMLIRYVDAEGMQEAELSSLTLRERATGAVVPLPAARPESFRPIPPRGQFGFGPTGYDSMAVPPNRFAAFQFTDLRLEYVPYEVSGVLVLRRAGEAAREVPFAGALIPQPRRTRRNPFSDAVESV